MGDGQQEGGGAGAPGAEGGAPATVPARFGERADNIAELIRNARSKPGSSPKEKLIAEAMEKSETEEMRRAIGLDIPFNVRQLLTRGVVEQVGMKVADNMFVDMHTLSKAEDILAERLVEALNGPMPLSKAYVEAKLVATLAMAITRINRDRFPVPDLDMDKRNTDAWKADWELKIALAKMLMAMTPGDIDGLGVIYANLDKMDVLLEEEARKKSGRP